MKKSKKKNSSKIQKANGTQGTIRLIAEALHLEKLPNSSKVNLACGLILLVGLSILVAVPVLSLIDSMVTSICNTLISIFSTRGLLPTREIDNGRTAIICIICFAAELLLCPIVVFIFDGFKNMKK